jgi:hypothetical protein
LYASYAAAFSNSIEMPKWNPFFGLTSARISKASTPRNLAEHAGSVEELTLGIRIGRTPQLQGTFLSTRAGT